MGIGLTTVIGSGIWRDSLLWPNAAGILSLVTVSIGWLLFICAGLAYAECVSMFPKGGGPYSYVGGAFGDKAGAYAGLLYLVAYFFIGTVLCFLTALFTLAAFDTNSFSFLTPGYLALFTCLYLLIFTILAGLSSPKVLGLATFSWVAIKIVLVIVVFIIALTNWQSVSVNNLTGSGFQVGINSSLWALMGFEVMLVFAGNTKDVEKTMPKAILIVLPIILVLYLFVAFAGSSIISIGEIAADAGTIDVMMTLVGKTGIPAVVIFIFAAFSAAGTAYAMLATCFQQSRVLAADKVLPEVFQKKVGGVDLWNILLTLAITIPVGLIMTLTSKYWDYSVDFFANAGVALVLISALLPAGISALYLRIKLPALNRPFKTPIYFIVFPLAVLLSLYLLVLNFFDIVNLWPALVLFIFICLITLPLIFLLPKTRKEEEIVETE